MKRFSYILFSMIPIMLFAGGSMAQTLVGESDPFIFDTRNVIPLSNTILLIFFILAASLIIYRYYLKKRKAAL